MPDFSKLVEWVKLSPRHLLAILIFTGFVLFASERWPTFFGGAGFVDSLKPVFMLVFLASAALLLVAAMVAVGGWVVNWRRQAQREKDMRQRLHDLSEPEKEILRGYIEGGTRTQYLSMLDGVVGGLVAEHILFRSSSLAHSFDHFAYNIQPWAWDYLNKHPKLLY